MTYDTITINAQASNEIEAELSEGAADLYWWITYQTLGEDTPISRQQLERFWQSRLDECLQELADMGVISSSH